MLGLKLVKGAPGGHKLHPGVPRHIARQSLFSVNVNNIVVLVIEIMYFLSISKYVTFRMNSNSGLNILLGYIYHIRCALFFAIRALGLDSQLIKFLKGWRQAELVY